MPARRLLLALLLVAAPVTVWSESDPVPAWITHLQPASIRLFAAATATDFACRRLAELTDRFGHRLSGSANLERAIKWAVATMKTDGLEKVRTEPVMVPRWI